MQIFVCLEVVPFRGVLQRILKFHKTITMNKLTLTSTLISTLILALTLTLPSFSQTSKKVLFLGNSYTYVNDLPTLLHDVALSAGDTVFFDSNSPGGYSFQMHTVDATSIAKIMMGGWDYVVLQEQSQMPSFPISQVQTETFPYARKLDSLINAYNPCAETVFYMTWGRKNGDASNCASWPPVCTYQGMDSLLKLRYSMMANDNQAILSPVGAVFHYIRDNYPLIELYQADESLPSAVDSFAADCCFYCSIFRKDPNLIHYQYTVTPTEFTQIIQAVKTVVYDSLINWNVGAYDPKAQFSTSAVGLNVQFYNLSTFADSYLWDFGDANTSTLNQPLHTYAAYGTYSVLLNVFKCNQIDTLRQTISVVPISIDEAGGRAAFSLYPNPAKTHLTLSSPNLLTSQSKIIISDVSGRKLKEQIILTPEKNISIELNGLSNGMYFVSVLDEKQVLLMRKKMVVVL